MNHLIRNKQKLSSTICLLAVLELSARHVSLLLAPDAPFLFNCISLELITLDHIPTREPSGTIGVVLYRLNALPVAKKQH